MNDAEIRLPVAADVGSQGQTDLFAVAQAGALTSSRNLDMVEAKSKTILSVAKGELAAVSA